MAQRAGPDAETVDVVIVGGGFAGVEVGAQLRRLSPSATVAIVSPSPSMLYRPWLIYLPVERIALEQAQIDLRPWAQRHRIRLVDECVQSIDPGDRAVRLRNGARLRYSVLALATGAVSDRHRIAGGDRHALWPCDLEDALSFSRLCGELASGVVTVIAAGERPGPGLEYAGWLARTWSGARRLGRRVRLLDHEAALRRQLGARALTVIRQFFESRGHDLVEGQVVAIDPHSVQVASGPMLESAVTAVVGPLAGCTDAFPDALLDQGRFVAVDRSGRSLADTRIYAVGDVASLAGDLGMVRSWIMARLQARTVAFNALATHRGEEPVLFDVGRARRFALSMPDIGGTTVVVKNGKLLLRGRLPLLLRAWMDHRYLRNHRK